MFTLPELPYSYNALEPHIDARTMEIHHSKHHAWYTNNLNTALEGTDRADKDIETILTSLDDLPADKKQAIINNGWGYYNHLLFWYMLAPNGGGEPTGAVSQAITDSFGSFDTFKVEFTAKALSVFGSGRARLCIDQTGALTLKRTSEQNNPISKGLTPILGIDVREHAYYLKHQNKRADYIDAFWQIVNWEFVNELYTDTIS